MSYHTELARVMLARLSRAAVVVGTGCYVASMVLPAFTDGVQVTTGIEAFVLALVGAAPFAWLANPLFLVGLVLWRRYRVPEAGALFSGLAFACAAIGVAAFLSTDQGRFQTPTVGVYAWMLSFALVAVGMAGLWLGRPNRPTPDQ